MALNANYTGITHMPRDNCSIAPEKIAWILAALADDEPGGFIFPPRPLRASDTAEAPTAPTVPEQPTSSAGEPTSWENYLGRTSAELDTAAALQDLKGSWDRRIEDYLDDFKQERLDSAAPISAEREPKKEAENPKMSTYFSGAAESQGVTPGGQERHPLIAEYCEIHDQTNCDHRELYAYPDETCTLLQLWEWALDNRRRLIEELYWVIETEMDDFDVDRDIEEFCLEVQAFVLELLHFDAWILRIELLRSVGVVWDEKGSNLNSMLCKVGEVHYQATNS